MRREFICRFNKRREDFKSLREFNDYLEDVEEISTLHIPIPIPIPVPCPNSLDYAYPHTPWPSFIYPNIPAS